ncbi:IclR family transcriptional regulator [Pseudonocardia sp. CA-107938]|uniref:IclR family transcriptional regulator n=1 Tax=Pseudonocardia sp. CA-107938 TaxID=3240021 RepID=UPI003D8C122A
MGPTDNVQRNPAPEAPSILSKAFDILRAFDSANRVMTLSEIARASGLPKSTVHRLLGRLVELDVVEHHGPAEYKIGLSMLRIGAVSPAVSLRDQAVPALHALNRWTGYAVQLAVLRQFDVVFLDKLEGVGHPSPPIAIGARVPAHCVAVGKALLAHEELDDLALFLPSRLSALTERSQTSATEFVRALREVRRDGIALEVEEYHLGFSGLGAAIIVNGYAVGALSVAFPSDAPAEPNTSRAVRETAAALARDLRLGLTPDRLRWMSGLAQRWPGSAATTGE